MVVGAADVVVTWLVVAVWAINVVDVDCRPASSVVAHELRTVAKATITTIGSLDMDKR